MTMTLQAPPDDKVTKCERECPNVPKIDDNHNLDIRAKVQASREAEERESGGGLLMEGAWEDDSGEEIIEEGVQALKVSWVGWTKEKQSWKRMTHMKIYSMNF